MIFNNKPFVPLGTIAFKYSNTSNLFKLLAFLAKKRIVLLSIVVGFLKKS